MLLFPRWKEICSTPLSQCNRIGEEFNFKSVREKSDERYGFNRSRKTMPGSDRASPFELKARCAFVRQSPSKSSIFILGTR